MSMDEDERVTMGRIGAGIAAMIALEAAILAGGARGLAAFRAYVGEVGRRLRDLKAQRDAARVERDAFLERAQRAERELRAARAAATASVVFRRDLLGQWDDEAIEEAIRASWSADARRQLDDARPAPDPIAEAMREFRYAPRQHGKTSAPGPYDWVQSLEAQAAAGGDSAHLHPRTVESIRDGATDAELEAALAGMLRRRYGGRSVGLPFHTDDRVPPGHVWIGNGPWAAGGHVCATCTRAGARLGMPGTVSTATCLALAGRA